MAVELTQRDAVVGANLADNRSIAAETPGRQRLVTTRPRTVGLEARYRF